jgi:signal transduction histidine kinase
LIGRFALPVAGVLVAHLILLVFMMAFASSGAGALFFVLLILAIDAAVIYVLLRAAKARATVVAGVDKICGGDLSYKVEETGLSGDNLALAKAINQIGDAVSEAVETSRRDERMKAELITNVSHDIKTPLTSIINYIDLIRRENIADETIKGYVDILEAKSQRLKQLTDDLVEISKISSGNIVLQLEKINLTELVNQMVGEFSEKYAAKSLQFSIKASEENICIRADSRHIWRVVENLCINIHKYALAGTRVYVDIAKKESGQVALEIKNISEQPLNFTADELTERFVRGDDARSTEGSGLGLSIAKSLTEAQGGGFAIAIDGDLFKVVLSFPLLANSS